MYEKTVEEGNIVGFFTDKEGTSPSPYMNMEVREALGLMDFPWVRSHQIHSDEIRYVDSVLEDTYLEGYDALVTAEPGIALVTVHADCIPVQLYDPDRGVIAAVHAGWKGTALGIAAKAATYMRDEFDCNNIHAYIGPGISLCCFEVGEEVAERFMDYEGACICFGEKYHVDLKRVNEMQLKEAGVENISVSDSCTFCDDRFVSYRRDGGTDQRMASIIVMLP